MSVRTGGADQCRFAGEALLRPFRVMGAGKHVFDRVVCGADGSDAGAAALELAARVVAPDGSLALVTVDDPSIAVHAGWRMANVAEELAGEAIEASGRAQARTADLRRVETRLLEGDPLDSLRSELDRLDATLAVVGMHGRSRVAGITLGSVTTHLLHEAPCSVLVARAPREPDAWPSTIVVGVDGSPGSVVALEAARVLAERTGARLRPVSATREPQVDLETARRLAPDLDELDDHVLHALHDLSEEADLLVVGSRGLRGIRALGSVGERIAHEALSPVLVVRGGTA